METQELFILLLSCMSLVHSIMKVLADGSTFSCHISHTLCIKKNLFRNSLLLSSVSFCVHSHTQKTFPNFCKLIYRFVGLLLVTHHFSQHQDLAFYWVGTSPAEPLLPSHTFPLAWQNLTHQLSMSSQMQLKFCRLFLLCPTVHLMINMLLQLGQPSV